MIKIFFIVINKKVMIKKDKFQYCKIQDFILSGKKIIDL